MNINDASGKRLSKDRRRELKRENNLKPLEDYDVITGKGLAGSDNSHAVADNGEFNGKLLGFLLWFLLFVFVFIIAGAGVGGFIISLTFTLIASFLYYYFRLPPDVRAELADNSQYGVVSANNICPHCQAKGLVRTKRISRKKGISGAKATGALLTGGVSLFATGLSRKEISTQAHCSACNSTWDY